VATVHPQPPATRFDEPLTDDDLDALADDVESVGIEFDWMTGFLTAMATGPDLVPPSEWVRVVFGEDPFTDLDDAQLKIGRLMRWYNEIVSAMFYEPRAVYRGRDEINRVAGAIKATHPDFARGQPHCDASERVASSSCYAT
jgi:hypothetical protein